jgi:curved DNA-binding protein CbpA
MINNYYDAIATLGLAEGASKDEVRAAFRSLSKKYHPDLYKGDNGESFKRINQAYQYLKGNNYSQPISYTYQQSTTTSYQETEKSTYRRRRDYYSEERKEKRRRYRERKRKEQEARKALILKIVKKSKLFVYVVLVLNSFLLFDYLMPTEESVSKLDTVQAVVNADGTKGSTYKLKFANGNIFYLSKESTRYLGQAQLFRIKKSLLFGYQLSLQDNQNGYEYFNGVNVFKTFAFIIFLQALFLLLFFSAKNPERQLNLIIYMGFCFLVQFALMFMH